MLDGYRFDPGKLCSPLGLFPVAKEDGQGPVEAVDSCDLYRWVVFFNYKIRKLKF
jgi:hypothetical protein